ncbi:MAG: PKD domain-containing protein [Bacteroidota bacterium]
MNFFRTQRSYSLRIGIATLVFLFTCFCTLSFAQSGLCDPTTPFYNVDLSANPNSTWTSPPVARVDHCCGVTGTARCIEFSVTLAPSAVAINFDVASGANPPGWFYEVNCGPQIPMGTPICLTGPGPYTITFCKPGANLNTYKITSIGGPTGSPDKTIGNGCNTTMSITGVVNPITWNSIYPGAIGAYNSYLSCTSGCPSTVVTSLAGHPPYVDYQVCGTTLGIPPCVPAGTFCDTIRVYMSTPVVNTVNPNPASFCANNPSVLLTGTVNGGVAPYTYAWTNGANGTGAVVGTGVSFTATAIGNYSFIVYDQNYPGCPAPITNVTVTSSPVPTINAGIDQTVCGTSLTLNGTVTGATGGIWSGGSGTFTPGNTSLNATYTPTLAELTSGTVILTLTSTGNGACSPVSDQVVLFISTPIIATITSPTLICYGQTASITVNASGGVAPYTYLWNTGETTQSIFNVLPGTHSVTVTGGSPGFCTSSASVILSTNPQIILTTPPNNAIVCSAMANISASATGGTGVLSYLWSNGATTSSTSVNTGTYTITVTDAVGCSVNNSVSVTTSSSLTATVNQPTVLCNGAVTTLNVTPGGGLGGYTFLWNTGATTTSISAGAGSYCATVTDAGGCVITACVTLIQNPALIVSIPTPAIICNGSLATVNATASGGQAPYSFLWNTGQTSQTLVATAGTYTVTVTDFTGCVNTATVNISQASAINIAMSSVDVGCFGGNNGSATAIVSGGVASYFYSWSPYGGSSATASSLLTGTYTLTVTDAIGCTLPATVVVSTPLVLAATITVQNQVSCNGGANGAAIVNPTGGTPAYSYVWSPIGGTVQNPTNLSVGSYTVTVTDFKGCIKTVQTTITEPTPLTASIVSTTDIACNGGSTGSATIIAAGGSPGYTYSWAPAGGTNATATNLTLGTYTVTITDSKTCTTSLTILINQPPPLTSIISNSTNLICDGDTNGSATVAPSGGTATYTYAWNTSPVQTTAIATNLSAGTYSVTVTDFKNCSVISPSVTISGPPAIIATASPSALISCNSSVSISSSAIGGVGAYTYLWNTGAITSAITVNTGDYIITITDAVGCSASDSVSVLASNSTLAATIVQPPNICFGTTTSVTVSVSGGLGSNSYLWSTNATTASITAGAGSYCVTVTDAGGCIATACVTIVQNPQISVTIATPQNICPGAATSVTAVGAGGQPAYSYLWSSLETTQSIVKPLGTYTVTISDITGISCSATANVTITEAPPVNAAMSFTNVSCFGLTNGTALVNASGGTPGYTYSWAPSGGTNASATLLGQGSYTVTVTDLIGCVKTGNATITQPATIVAIALTSTDNLCFGDSIGTATATGSGGTSPYFYYWQVNADTLATITGLIAGTYSAYIADNTGCSVSSSVAVAEPPELIITATASQITCFGGTGSVVLVTSGGTGALVITGDATTNLAAGTYNYTVTDANLCSKTIQTIIDPAPSLLTFTATPTQITCFGGTGSVALMASGGTGTLVITGDVTNNLLAGIYNYTVTDSNGCIASASATINAVSAITLTATASQIACFGGTGSVGLVAAGGTGTLLISGDGTTNLVPGTYNYTVTDANSCIANASANINYGPLTAVTLTATATQIICSGGTGSVGLTAAGGTGALTITGDNTTSLAAGTYNYTVTDANGCAAIAQAIVDPAPSAVSITATPTQISCFGGTGSVALVVSGGTGTLVITGDATTNLLAGTYNYTVTDSNSCTAVAQAIINAAPSLLTVTLSTTQITCFGLSNGTIAATCNGGTSPFYYTWQNGETTAATTNLAIGTYSVAVSDNKGCLASSSTITISEPPEIILSATTVSSTCGLNNGSATATAVGGTGAYTYLWSPSGGTDALAGSLLADDYTVTVTDSNACQKQLPLTVASASFLIANFNGTEECYNDPTVFTDSSMTSPGSTITSWVWDFGNSSPLDNSPNPTYVYPAPGLYNVSLTVTSSNGCISTLLQPVLVHFLPVAGFVSSKVCLGSSTVFTDISSVAGSDSISSWLWVFGDLSTSGTIQNPSHTYGLAGTYNTILLVSSDFGCSDTSNVPSIVYAPPVVHFIVDDSSGCIIHCPQFTDTSDPLNGTITNWQWNFGDLSPAGSQPIEEHCYTNSGIFTVSLTVTTSNGCFSTISQTDLINVYEAPVAEFDYSPQPPTSVSSYINFNNLSNGASSWSWNFGDVNSTNGSALEFPTHNYSEIGNYCITLIVKNNDQCVDTVIHCLEIEPEFTFFIPNAFTPNESEGTNDGFTGFGTNISKYDMWIFDRWGNMIFHTEDLGISWDGKAKKGKEMAQRDVYVYLVELKDFKGMDHQYRGIVTLVR